MSQVRKTHLVNHTISTREGNSTLYPVYGGLKPADLSAITQLDNGYLLEVRMPPWRRLSRGPSTAPNRTGCFEWAATFSHHIRVPPYEIYKPRTLPTVNESIATGLTKCCCAV